MINRFYLKKLLVFKAPIILLNNSILQSLVIFNRLQTTQRCLSHVLCQISTTVSTQNDVYGWCNDISDFSRRVISSLRLGHTKDYEIGIFNFFTNKRTALRSKNKDWLVLHQDNVSVWGDMSTRGLLFQ